MRNSEKLGNKYWRLKQTTVRNIFVVSVWKLPSFLPLSKIFENSPILAFAFWYFYAPSLQTYAFGCKWPCIELSAKVIWWMEVAILNWDIFHFCICKLTMATFSHLYFCFSKLENGHFQQTGYFVVLPGQIRGLTFWSFNADSMTESDHFQICFGQKCKMPSWIKVTISRSAKAKVQNGSVGWSGHFQKCLGKCVKMPSWIKWPFSDVATRGTVCT